MGSSYVHLDNESLNKLSQIQRDNLKQLEMQSANFGPLGVPINIINQINQVKAEILEINTELMRRGYPIKANATRNQDVSPSKGRNFVAILSLTIALVSCLAAVIVVPEVRQILNIDKPNNTPTIALGRDIAQSLSIPTTDANSPIIPNTSIPENNDLPSSSGTSQLWLFGICRGKHLFARIILAQYKAMDKST